MILITAQSILVFKHIYLVTENETWVIDICYCQTWLLNWLQLSWPAYWFFWPLPPFFPSHSRLCNGLSGTPRSPACVPLSCVRALFPLLYSWGGCDFPPGQRSLRGQDCQDLPCGEHDSHHAWLSSGGQWQSGPGPGTWCSEPTPTATEPGQYQHCVLFLKFICHILNAFHFHFLWPAPAFTHFCHLLIVFSGCALHV